MKALQKNGHRTDENYNLTCFKFSHDGAYKKKIPTSIRMKKISEMRCKDKIRKKIYHFKV